MHLRSSIASLASLILLSQSAGLALAAGVFPDVGDSHPFKGQIESLVRAGVLKGNPDGTFSPDRSVNRAELLKMLYTAAGKQPKAINAKCFADVTSGAWYELIVCDAASRENGFVQGYGDGTFRPGNPVTRTEALKMIFTVLRISASDIATGDKDIIKFADISTAAWYSKYVSAAYKNGMLPIAGFGGARFYPDQEITRAEAAALIFGALNLGSSPASSSSSSARSSTSDLKQVSFPFDANDHFVAKAPMAYEFTINSPRVISISVAAVGTVDATLTCRLFLFGENDFTTEYYLGVQTANRCNLVVSARPGRYQVQLQSSVADLPYFVTASSTSGDGNDGFTDAVSLAVGADISGSLEGTNDLYDWYTVKIDSDRSGTIFASGKTPVSCIVYVPLDIDQFGFSGPQCGLQYDYKAGTYTVGIGRANGTDLSQKVDYVLHAR